MLISRRSFLGSLTAGIIAAPAIVRASSLMPVKAWQAPWTPLDLSPLYWQDLEGTIPVVHDGDPVARIDAPGMLPLVQHDPALRPIYSTSPGLRVALDVTQGGLSVRPDYGASGALVFPAIC